jgi:hypothetical protein
MDYYPRKKATREFLAMTAHCNDVMLPGKDSRKLLGWKNVRCMKDPGHEGNHSCNTRQCYFEWWNPEKNPQKNSKEKK